jgi:protein-tyrosine-phosphatase
MEEQLKRLLQGLAKQLDDPYGGSKSANEIDYDEYVEAIKSIVKGWYPDEY